MVKRKFAGTTQDELRRVRRRLRTVLGILAALVVLIGVYVYLNYDYLAFKHFISGHYIYTDTLDKIFEDELKRDVGGKYYRYFDDLVISVMTRRIRDENDDRYTYLYIPEDYKKYVENTKQTASNTEIKVLDDSTVYFRLTNYSKYSWKLVKQGMDTLKSRDNIIIDLRDNGGGDTHYMKKLIDLFLPPRTVMNTDHMRLLDITYKSRKKQQLIYQDIIILQNPNTASASENFLSSLDANLPNVVLMGEKTFGKGIGQLTLPLTRGFKVKATTMLWYTPEGINIHGAGVDAEVPYSGVDILDYAARYIKR